MSLFKLARVELIATLMVVSLLALYPIASAQSTEPAAAESSTLEHATPSAASADDPALTTALVSESENADLILQRHPFSLENQSKDPFKPLIEKPKPVVIPVDQVKKEDVKRIAPPEQIKPLVVNVQGICGNEGSRWALVTYNNQVRVITQDMNVDGAFKVVAVENDRLVVYSNKHQSRQTFALTKQ